MIAARAAALLFALFFALKPALALEDSKYQNLLTPLLSADADIVGQPLAYPSGKPKVTAAIVTIPPGGETGWHLHRVPLFVYVMEGEVTVDYGSKGTKVYTSGQSLMEAMNWAHNGMNKSAAPVKILAVYMGGDDKTNVEPAPAPTP
jgi:quercetin dioxygenase-like cupin family protein